MVLRDGFGHYEPSPSKLAAAQEASGASKQRQIITDIKSG